MVVLSTGQIAEEIGQDRDRVSYAIRKTGVKPVGRAGLVRLFPQSAVSVVREFLESKQATEKRIPMPTTTAEKAQATAGTGMARSQDRQAGVSANHNSLSRGCLLEQAAEILCLLSLFPLSERERAGFVALLDRRLHRAYAGAHRTENHY